MSTVARPIRVGIFATLRAADRAVADLVSTGFTKDQISVVCSNEAVERHFEGFHHEDPAGTTTPRNAAVGGAIGATLGGLGVLAGAAATGGASLLFTGGIAAWAGAVFGGLIGAMTSRGVEREVADYYDQAVQSGKILVAVDMEEEGNPSVQAQRLAAAEDILADAGAEPLPLREG
jgi:hypothetical protein